MAEKIPFFKMEGLGNDYVFLDCLKGPPPEDPATLSQMLSDRRRGVGGDGLILLLPAEGAAAAMRIFNPDGSEAEMCGNGIRCAAKYLYERGYVKEERFAFETAAGLRAVEILPGGGRVVGVRADMGPPELDPARILARFPGDRALDEPIDIAGRTVRVSCVSMGNPHAVVFTEALDDTRVHTLGPAIEHHPAFPNRTNVEFVRVRDRKTLQVRVWERGAGETLACGTGACAAAVAAALTGRAERAVTVHLPGGVLEIEWVQNGRVTMTGPARFLFEGVFFVDR